MVKKPLGIYVHIPFCVRKCLYCDFVSGPATEEEMAYYLRVLLKEIHGFEALGSLYEVCSVFFGGGTPSLPEASYLEKILKQLREQFDFDRNAEITVECNPGTLSEEKLAAYRRMGVGRLSIGLQSVHPKELELMGRIHSYEDFLNNYETARKLGFKNINVDLMSGLPYQTMNLWHETLETVTALHPEHISAYSLTIERGTPFFDTYVLGVGYRALPGEELERDMYHHTKEFLASRGYKRYEISNYAREGFESRHNMLYWTGGEYLGFGQNAASYVDGRRFSNPPGKADYWTHAREAYQAYKNTPPLSKKEREEEYMFLGLRTSRGVSAEEFAQRFGEGFPPVYDAVIEKNIREGLLHVKDRRIVLTDAGIDISNRVMAEFLQD